MLKFGINLSSKTRVTSRSDVYCDLPVFCCITIFHKSYPAQTFHHSVVVVEKAAVSKSIATYVILVMNYIRGLIGNLLHLYQLFHSFAAEFQKTDERHVLFNKTDFRLIHQNGNVTILIRYCHWRHTKKNAIVNCLARMTWQSKLGDFLLRWQPTEECMRLPRESPNIICLLQLRPYPYNFSSRYTLRNMTAAP